MNRRLKIRWLCWLVMLVASPGCLVTHHATNIVREQEPRREVRFESDQVRQAFEARVADLKDRGDKPHKERVLAIPFLLWWSREEVLAENAWYNDQVAACDANRDSLITYQEALNYNPRFREGVTEVAGWNAEQAAANARTAYEQPLPPPAPIASQPLPPPAPIASQPLPPPAPVAYQPLPPPASVQPLPPPDYSQAPQPWAEAAVEPWGTVRR